MPLSLLPSLLLQILVVGYTPGPANIYSLAMSLKYGRRQSLVMWFGLLTGFSIAVCLMAVLAHCIGLAFAGYIQYLKYLGAAYILFLAYKVRKNRQESGGKHDDCSFTSGMLVQMTNAKMLLFDLTAFSTFVLPYSNELADLLAVGAWAADSRPGGQPALVGSRQLSPEILYRLPATGCTHKFHHPGTVCCLYRLGISCTPHSSSSKTIRFPSPLMNIPSLRLTIFQQTISFRSPDQCLERIQADFS